MEVQLGITINFMVKAVKQDDLCFIIFLLKLR